MRFESPLAFLLLLLLVPWTVWLWRARRAASVRFSTVTAAAQAGGSVKLALVWVPGGLRVAALTLLVIALARPQKGIEQVRDYSRGVAIMMVLDRSGSMGQELEYRGEHRTRLEVVKEVFRQFVLGDPDAGLRGRPNDLVGMVAFARYSDTICPLTLSHGALEHFLEHTEVVTRESEDGTAIGDALALAAARLEKAEDTLRRQVGDTDDVYEIKSKVIILLTDGENNCGERSVADAAELAGKWGIRVHTIAVTGDDAVGVIRTPLGTFRVPGRRGRVDTHALEDLAERTGGLFQTADDVASLQDVYREIDRLEKTDIESIRFMDYRELFWPFACAALLVLCVEIILRNTVFRRVP